METFDIPEFLRNQSNLIAEKQDIVICPHCSGTKLEPCHLDGAEPDTAACHQCNGKGKMTRLNRDQIVFDAEKHGIA